jgi:phosphate transport system ATP-binding protein
MKKATDELYIPMATDICSEGNICVEDLNVYYGDRHALKNINIILPAKKITAIIGPSGCGKTTLLKCFNRLIDSIDGTRVTGKVLVNGENIFDPDADVINIRKKMGLLSQRPYPLPMSIYDNVAYGPRIHGIRKKSELDQLVEYYLKEASLWDEVKDRLHAPASGLSIGQQQRLCLARGLAVKPEIILGDEPTSALDPISSANIEEKFVEFKEKYTIILVTHILRQATRIADYIIFMYLGEIIEHGPAYQILENPKDERTADYINGIIS